MPSAIVDGNYLYVVYVAPKDAANPAGAATFGYFEWGATTNYGNVTSAQLLGGGIGKMSRRTFLSFNVVGAFIWVFGVTLAGYALEADGLMHALREFRGDGHIACLVADDVDGCQALVLHGAMGEVPASILQATRSRTDEEWAAAVASLQDRGWLDAAGELTEVGRARHRHLQPGGRGHHGLTESKRARTQRDGRSRVDRRRR